MYFSNNNSTKNCSCAGFDLVGLSSSLAIFISKNVDSDDLGLLGALFTTLGDNISLIAASRTDCESSNECNESPKSSDEFSCTFNKQF